MFVFLREIVRLGLTLINGRPKFYNQDRLPDKNTNYILVAPHRMALEPVYFAFATRPKQFIFMAKKELFKHRFLGWWIKVCGAFPVDRENPSPKTLKYAVKMLKDSDKSLIMFPSGSRHSDQMKGGVAVIGLLSKVPLVPVVYQGPMNFKSLFRRQKVKLNFGQPITLEDIKKADDDGIAEVNRRMEAAFSALDAEMDPKFHYDVK